MATTGGVTLDSVVISIESKANGAYEGIEKLSRSLSNLKTAIKGGFGNLTKLSTALDTLTKVAPKLDETVESLKGIDKLKDVLKPLSEIPSATGLVNVINNLEKLPDIFARITPDTLANVARVSNELTSALTPLSNKMAEIGQGYHAINQLADRYGISVTKIRDATARVADSLGNSTTKLNKFKKALAWIGAGTIEIGKKSTNTLKRLNSKIKQIGLSLLGTRTIFTATRKAISEYMQMDAQLTWQTRNLWRALGAQLAPAVEYVLYLFKQFVRVVYSIVYALTGIDLIARANAKALANMGKAAAKALGNLQKFDDLNVVEFNKGTGDDSQIVLDKIDLTPIKKLVEWMRKLKKAIEDAIDTGNWTPIFEVLKDGIIDFIEWIPWHEIGTAIHDVLMDIDWRAFFEGAWEILTEVFEGLSEFLNGLFGQEEGSGFGSDLLATFLAIYGVIKAINGVTGLAGILKTIGVIAEAPSLATLLVVFGGISVIALSIYKGIKSWKEALEDPTSENKLNAIYDTLLTIVGVAGGIALLIGAWPVALGAALGIMVLLVAKWISQNTEKINKWWDGIITSISEGFQTLVANVFNWFASKFEDFINNKIVKNVNKIIKKINEILELFGSNHRLELWADVYLGRMVKKSNTGGGQGAAGGGGIGSRATGGFVPNGQFFYANENGIPELIGTMGNRAAVANNHQIIEGIKQGVYEAMSMSGTQDGGPLIINLGNKTLYRGQQRYNKQQNDKYGTTVNL